MKNKLLYLVQTHFGRLISFGILFVIGGLFAREGAIGEIIYNPLNVDKFDLFEWILYIGIIGGVGYGLVMLAFAWVINPIKKLIKKFNVRE